MTPPMDRDQLRVSDLHAFYGESHILHGVEILAPVVWHGARIFEVRFVQFFYVRRIPTEQVGRRRLLLHHFFAHLSSRFARN